MLLTFHEQLTFIGKFFWITSLKYEEPPKQSFGLIYSLQLLLLVQCPYSLILLVFFISHVQIKFEVQMMWGYDSRHHKLLLDILSYQNNDRKIHDIFS
jgi:hypothetical protein